jgi:hypothetical protein
MTEDKPDTETPAAPVIETADEHAALLVEMEARRAEEAVIAAEQDAALQAVRDECNAFREAAKTDLD